MDFLETLELRLQTARWLAYARFATYMADSQYDMDDRDDILDAIVELNVSNTSIPDDELEVIADELIADRDRVRALSVI